MRYAGLGFLALISAWQASGQQLAGPGTVEYEGVAGQQGLTQDEVEQATGTAADGQRMTVDVRIGGQGPFDFLVDTGADGTVVSSEVAGRLRLGRDGAAMLHSVTGARSVPTTSIEHLEFSARTRRNIPAAVLDHRHIGADGILGIDSLRSQRVTFDFAKRTMSIVPSKTRPERRQKDEVVVRGKLRSGRLVLTRATAARRRISVVVDTGADVSIGNQALFRALRRSGLLRGGETVQMKSVTGELLTGDLRSLDQFEIGGVIVRNLSIVFVDAHTFKTLGLENKPALLMGMNTLKAFEKVSIDFASRKFRVVVPGESSIRSVRLASR